MTVLQLAMNKAKQSRCHYAVSAIGFDKHGKIVAVARNTPRSYPKFNKPGGNIHAELAVLRKGGKRIRSIVLCRVGKSGELKRIDPCKSCMRVLNKNEIKVLTLSEVIGDGNVTRR